MKVVSYVWAVSDRFQETPTLFATEAAAETFRSKHYTPTAEVCVVKWQMFR